MDVLQGLLQDSLHPLDNAVRNAAQEKLDMLIQSNSQLPAALLEFVANKQVDKPIRFIAISYVKTFVNRYWAVREGSVIFGDNERNHLKQKLFELLEEEDTQVATQIALALSLIVRSDFPMYWPDFFPLLFNLLKNSQSIVFRLRAFLALKIIIKDLVGMKKVHNLYQWEKFGEISGQLTKFVATIWLSSANDMLNALKGVAQAIQMNSDSFAVVNEKLGLEVTNAELCKLALATLISLLNHHCLAAEESDEDSDLNPILSQILEVWKGFIACATTLPQNNLTRYVDAQITRIAFLAFKMVSEHPFHFASSVLPFLDISMQQILQFPPQPFSPSTPNVLPDKFLINCMAYTRQVVELIDSYQFAADLPELSETLENAMKPEIVMKMCQVLMSHYMVITDEELEQWEEEPEVLANEDFRGAWTERIRSTAELLFDSVARKWSEEAYNVIVNALQQILQLEKEKGQLSLDELRTKDAIYFAVATSSVAMSGQKFQFTEFLQNQLVADVQNPDPRYKIIRKSVAYILDCWSRSVNDSEKDTILAYEILLAVLGSSDMVGRLYAAVAFKNVIDDISFKPDVMEKYLEKAVELIFKLIGDISESETNIQIIHIVSILISQMGDKMKPYTSKMLQCLSYLWERSKANKIQMASSIQILQDLVRALGSKATDFYEFLLPVLAQCTDPASPDYLYIAEDGVKLWLTVLRFVPFNPILFQLWPRIAPVLQLMNAEDTELINQMLEIVEAYIFLGGSEFLMKNLSIIMGILGEVFSHSSASREDSHLIALRIADLLIQSYPNEVPALLSDILERILLLGFTYPETDEQTERLGSDRDVSLYYYGLLIRVLIANSSTFLEFFQKVTLKAQEDKQKKGQAPLPNSLLYIFFENWLVKLEQMIKHPLEDCFSDTREDFALLRKKGAIGLLLFSTLPEVQKHLPKVIGLSSALINDFLEYKKDTSYVVTLDRKNIIAAERKKLEQIDPVIKADLLHVFGTKLKELAAAYPSLVTAEFLTQVVDPSVMAALKKM